MIRYNQRDVINEIHSETGYSIYAIERIFEALEHVIQEFLTDTDENVVIKFLPGLSIKKDIVSSEKTNLMLPNKVNGGNGTITFLSAKLTDYFKKKINKLRKEKANNNI